MNILLISGHGAGDPGAVGNGKREADETRRVTAALKPLLDGYADVTVYPTDRNAYADYQSGTLASVAKFSQYDFVLEVHFNALSASGADGKTKGTEIYVPTTESDITAAQAIVNAVSGNGLTNRGVKKYNWAVISRAKQSGVPAALLEVCFIDDADDMTVYQNKFAQIVQSIADGIIRGFGLKKEESPVTYEEFKAYLDRYLSELAEKQPSAWSADAREWAEANGVIQGDDRGQKRYKSYATREELAQMLYRILGTV